MEELKAEVQQLKLRVEALEEENHELRQLFIKQVVESPTEGLMDPYQPKPWCSDHYAKTGSYYHY